MLLASDHFGDQETRSDKPGGGAVAGWVIDFHARFVEVLDQAGAGGVAGVWFDFDFARGGTPVPATLDRADGYWGVGALPDPVEDGVGEGLGLFEWRGRGGGDLRVEEWRGG